jgi:guanylate kinase
MSVRGVLFLVVGPSGAGKDTLIDGARVVLADELSIRFQRRVITRPADAGGEDHIACTLPEFEAAEMAGAFMLSWRAHGLGYGIPTEASEALASGTSVIINVSRTVIDLSRIRFQPMRVVSIAAEPDVLRARLKARGRENFEVVEDRVRRAAAYSVEGPDVDLIVNDADIATGVAKIVDLIRCGVAAHSASG